MLTIPKYLFDRTRGWADHGALRWTGPDGDEELTHAELEDHVERFARGLVASGIQPGDRVYVHADNSHRWIIADLGILRAGAISVPRGADTTREEAEYIVRHSGANAIVVGQADQIDDVPTPERELHAKISLTGKREGVTSFEEILEAGAEGSLPPPEGEVATIVYTSGTTGTPKGVILTHANILHNVRVCPTLLCVGPGDLFLSVLPSWHMFERTVEYIVLSAGAKLFYSSIRTLKPDMLAQKPTFLAGVPRLFEGVEAGFRAKLEKKSPFARAFAKFLLARTLAWTRSRLVRKDQVEDPLGGPRGSRALATIGTVLRAPLGYLGSRVVGGPVRAAVGGSLRGAISGGGMLSSHLDLFLCSVGVPIIVGYGLTETSPVVTLRRPEDNVLGTIGRALPETEVRVVDEKRQPVGLRVTGELEVKGPQVMRGYYENEEATRAVLSEDGWFRTGDLVRMTEKGDFIFTGRRKETIVLAGGENIEPSPIEGRLIQSPFIRQVMVVGQDRKALGALVVPDRESATAEAMARRTTIEDLLRKEVNRLVSVRTGFKPRETIGRIGVVDAEFNVEDGTLTRTLKLRRNVILTKYAALIDSLYG